MVPKEVLLNHSKSWKSDHSASINDLEQIYVQSLTKYCKKSRFRKTVSATHMVE